MRSAGGRYVPTRIKHLLLTGMLMSLDLADMVLGRRDPLVPPRTKITVGSNTITRSDFKQIGNELFSYLTDIGGLSPTDRVLDVGCGIGRMAIPLATYLHASGEYYGFDIVKDGVEWCEKNLTRRFPHLHFSHSDVYNNIYNPRGKIRASSYRFPFEDNSFDFVILMSVFTHMKNDDLYNYLREIRRVMRDNGRCMITYFLYNEESQKLIDLGRSRLPFRWPMEHCMVLDRYYPEKAIAYDERFIRSLYRETGIKILGQIHYGSWCGRQTHVGFQDMVVGQKEV
jgi:SAM-dependent methyltransferase